ncbi:hypothetical protein [Clostridium sp. Marseille-P2415]|uniref:hypothetical protein n=1 Tax=Clostridium sp. Marseille-P2415 TaxID=1805471 RepID=UPI0009884CC3|nr:hypothetical protein [Clostridium sp. Marseille-P2415]
MIKSVAEWLGISPSTLIIGVSVFIIFVIVVLIKTSFDEKKGVNSQEKQDIRKLVSKIVPNGQDYMAAYAHGKDVHRDRTSTLETYYYYAIGFRPDQTDHLWLIPIGFENGRVTYIEPMRMDADSLSYISGNEFYMELHHPATNQTYTITVEASNTKLGKECPVNIQQKEETDAFLTFGKTFQETVNRKLGVDKKGRPLKNK